MNKVHEIKAIGIWGNTDKKKFWDLLPLILDWTEKNDLQVYISTRIEEKVDIDSLRNYKIIKSAEDFYKVDFLLCLGGDGTMLSAARAIGHRKTPLLGIHLGELGFMAEVTVKDMFERLNLVLKRQFGIQYRMVLKAEIVNDRDPEVFYALNDFVVDRGKSQRIITIQLLANNNYVANYKSDGLIISTPTGSTAYSLSVGGPIVMPKLKAIVVSPISPHTLSLRPIVFPDDRVLEISFPSKKEDEIAFAVDGQVNQYLRSDSKIIIERAPFDVSMIDFEDSNYFQTLRSKMGWGKRGEK